MVGRTSLAEWQQMLVLLKVEARKRYIDNAQAFTSHCWRTNTRHRFQMNQINIVVNKLQIFYYFLSILLAS